jgi:transcriptional regulator of met regulon
VKVTAAQYGEICDAVERTYQGWPLADDSGLLHTSREARAAATRIIEILGLEPEEPR